ncbi:MAG: glycosyltransferase [Bacteroidetes bacterium]|nr:glycosyltransferase [Bacteroidota bacterium]
MPEIFLRIMTVITIILVSGYAVFILFIILGWLKMRNQKLAPEFSANVSIIIPARNEETNIIPCLESFYAQEYPADRFEIIVVDDNSTDNTGVIIREFAEEKKKIPVRLITNTRSENCTNPKRNALMTGILESRGDLIITTDADCIVKSTFLKTVAGFQDKTGSVLTAGSVLSREGATLFSRIQALDYAALTGVAAGSSGMGKPLFCSWANLSFRKKEFFEAGGLDGLDRIKSGDDVFLMFRMKIKYPGRIHYIADPQASVYTQPERTLKTFLNQRSRWASKGIHYTDPFLITVSALVFLCNLSLLLFFPVSLFNNSVIILFTLLFILKSVPDFILLTLVTGHFNIRNLLWVFLPAQIFHVFYVTFAVFKGLSGSYTWKERNPLQGS